MIFVTVGAQMPFDRMIRAVDQWAGEHPGADIFAQIGESDYEPRHLRWEKFVTPDQLRELVQQSSVVVAHAGMGTILTSLQMGKPILVMPRRGSLRETRNDHQVATAKQLTSLQLVSVAWDEDELRARLDTCQDDLEARDSIPPYAIGPLCEAISGFLANPRTNKPIDGVICFGGVDWWYHNRGHYDIQMMRDLSERMPVLYVNSIGMRTPSVGEGRVFFKRVLRKIQSWRRGLVRVRENFGVLSPFSVPKFHQASWAKNLLVEQVCDAARHMGIENPLVWVACPPAAEVVERIPSGGIVYQRTDRFEHYPGVDSARIRAYDLQLKARSDVTLFCSTSVFEEERAECRKAVFVDHGVDYDQFASAEQGAEPADLAAIPHPRVGFVGGIDAHTFDPALFNEVAGQMPECAFVMVGGCSLPEGWCTLPNVHFLGRKPYEEVAGYMAACDVLIMPWNQSPWIKACNPVKLKEYLATGRPVVSTPFDELARYADDVFLAKDAASFVAAVRGALAHPPAPVQLRARVARETWTAKAGLAIAALEEAGVAFSKETFSTETAVGGETNVKTTTKKPSTPPVVAPRVPRYWRAPVIVATALLALAGLWVTADAWRDILRLGMQDEEASHVLLALPAALWIAWARRDIAAGARRSGVWLGPVIVAVGWALFAYGDIQLFQSIWHFGAILILVGCIVSMVGREVLFRLWPAFLVLLFLIPVPGIMRAQIAPPMQTVTAQMTAFLLQTAGEPVELSGKVLIVNGVSVGIAEACNGIRMVFALALVCFFYAFSTELSTRARVAIVIASPVVAIVVNVVRLVPTVWLYGHADVEFAETFHDMMGWAMMPIALVGLMGMRAVFHWALQEDPESPGSSGATALSPARQSGV